MSKLVKKNGKLVKKNGKFVKTDNVANCSCCGDGPCPPGKFCIWLPPDPCSTGKCQPSLISDTPIIQSQCGSAPYDCTSEQACNQWYAAHPNPPCDCWFCEDGEWVNKPSLNCINEGGVIGQKPPDGDCLPPPIQLWCCDGGTEGYFCGERVNVPGIGEMIGDAPIGICNSVNKVDDCADCGPPEPPCAGESEQGTWQLELCDEEDCKYVTCGQSGSGVGPKFLTQQACRDCHNLRETCSLDHPLCVLNRNPLP
jgi:hypothetical protein